MDTVDDLSSQAPHRNFITFVKDRPGHDRRYALNIDKIKRQLNRHPKKSIKTGLRETVEWYLGNLDWIEAVGSQPQYQAWINDNYSKRKKL